LQIIDRTFVYVYIHFSVAEARFQKGSLGTGLKTKDRCAGNAVHGYRNELLGEEPR